MYMTRDDVFYLDDTYADKVIFAGENSLTIEEIEPDENGRRFKFVDLYIPEVDELAELRYLREIECFDRIDRSPLWYDTLTDEQKEELKVWYKAWLEVTKTKIVPEKPKWL